MTLEVSAVSSMNYFFLRFVVKKPDYDIQIIKDELQNFVMGLNNEGFVTKDVERAIATELVEGSYFDGKTEQEMTQLIQDALKELVGEDVPDVTSFYIRLAKEMNVFDDE